MRIPEHRTFAAEGAAGEPAGVSEWSPAFCIGTTRHLHTAGERGVRTEQERRHSAEDGIGDGNDPGANLPEDAQQEEPAAAGDASPL